MGSEFGKRLHEAIGKPGHPLKVDAILDTLPDDEKTDILDALRTLTIPGAQIARALNLMGIECSERAVFNLRRKHVAL